MNGILVLPFMCREDEYFVARITWELFHYTLVGMSTELYVASELKACEGYCTKNTIVSSRTLHDKQDGEFNGIKRMD
jgi:hypothetical protein